MLDHAKNRGRGERFQLMVCKRNRWKGAPANGVESVDGVDNNSQKTIVTRIAVITENQRRVIIIEISNQQSVA